MRHYVYFVRGEKHRDMAIASAQSVLKNDTACELHICTDDNTDLSPAKPHFDHLGVAKFARPLRLMVANCAVICEYLLGAPPGQEFWFIDADTLLLEPLQMPGECQMAFTWRTTIGVTDEGEEVEGVAKDMPYNFGVVGAVSGPASGDAALWLRQRVAGYNTGYQDWYGNQMAAYELCGPIPAEGDHGIVERGIPWSAVDAPVTRINIARLPCKTWNYTPASLEEDVEGVRLLHFKGHRRALMPAYARSLGIEMADFQP